MDALTPLPSNSQHELILVSALLGPQGYILFNLFPHFLYNLQKWPRFIKLLGAVVAVVTVLPHAFARLRSIQDKLLTMMISSVSINASDNICHELRAWLAHRKTFTARESTWAASNTAAVLFGPLYQANNNEAIHVQPLERFSVFIHRGHVFGVNQDSPDSRTKVYGQIDEGRQRKYRRSLEILGNDSIVVSCLSWSRKPIIDLLKDIHHQYKIDITTRTSIFRQDRLGSHWIWARSRPSRLLSSLALDEDVKNSLLLDIDTYLAPTTQRWYEARGIPYRRGYLFHGPPGTGKTSLAMALAERYRLDVYMLSLLDPETTDRSLLDLFGSLPLRALILLEDIDSAGISREAKPRPLSKLLTNLRLVKGDQPSAAADSEAEEREKDGINKKRVSNVTLSGLLNAIDGAAAPEGHILLMTSNDPNTLDEALTRPGRVDVRVPFHFANRHQVKEMFLIMYFGVHMEPIDGSTGDVARKEWNEHEQDVKVQGNTAPTEGKETSVDLDQMAAVFARLVPEGEFSPAEVQEYLLRNRENPRGAIEGVEAWIAKIRSQNAPVTAMAAPEENAPNPESAKEPLN